MIRITSKRNGFRRCGVEHSNQAVAYPDGRFSAEQLKRLQADPMLVVEVIQDIQQTNPGGSADGGLEKTPDSKESKETKTKDSKGKGSEGSKGKGSKGKS